MRKHCNILVYQKTTESVVVYNRNVHNYECCGKHKPNADAKWGISDQGGLDLNQINLNHNLNHDLIFLNWFF